MEPLPEGTRAIVEETVDQAAQSLFTAADVPLSRADELLAILQGPALRAGLEARIEQIVKHGHTPESDVMLPMLMLAHRTREMLDAAADLLPKGDRRNLEVAKKRAARVIALASALFDRIEAEQRIETGK